MEKVKGCETPSIPPPLEDTCGLGHSNGNLLGKNKKKKKKKKKKGQKMMS